MKKRGCNIPLYPLPHLNGDKFCLEERVVVSLNKVQTDNRLFLTTTLKARGDMTKKEDVKKAKKNKKMLNEELEKTTAGASTISYKLSIAKLIRPEK